MRESLRTRPRCDERVDPLEQRRVVCLSERIPRAAGEPGELRDDLFCIAGSERDVDPVERPPQRLRVIDTAIREHGHVVHPHIIRGGGSKLRIERVALTAAARRDQPFSDVSERVRLPAQTGRDRPVLRRNRVIEAMLVRVEPSEIVDMDGQV